MAQSTDDRSWWSRNWGWCIGCGCVLPTLLIVGFVSAVIWGAKTLVDESGVMPMAVEYLESDPRVVEKLGEPIEIVWWDQVSINLDNNDAEIEVTVKGPKAKGRTDILAIKRGDDWVFEKFDLVVDGERLDLKP